MKRNFTVTALTLILGIAAPSAYAMTTSASLETGIVNHIQRIDPSIEVPTLDDKDLGYLKTVLEDSADQNWEKAAKVKLYFANF